VACPSIRAGCEGLLFVAISVSSGRFAQGKAWAQLHRNWGTLRDALFLLGLAVMFVVQLIQGSDIIVQPDNPGAVNTIAILVIACFAIGISRAWELIGAPSMGFTREVTELVRSHQRGVDDAGA
jgi:hypothetical protein